MSSTDSKTSRLERAAADAELVERVANQDADALGDLHGRFSGVLLALAHRVLGNMAEAEDVLQEVFVQVWKQASRYDPRRSSVSTWMVLITRSRAIDRLRSRQVGERTVAAVQAEKPARDTSPEGVQTVLFQERRERLQSALGNLPPEQREVIELAFYQAMTQSEIAEKTGIPLGTVKTRTLLAMKKLRKALESEIEELL